jgi:hypothetical protein
VARSSGELSRELALVLADLRAGEPFTGAIERLAVRVPVPAVTRFVDGLVVAVERGTPLGDVLRAQAADVREHHKRDLIEAGGRREVLMLVPRRVPGAARGHPVRPLPRPRLAVPDRPLTEGSSAMPWPHWPILRRLARLEGERGDVPGWVLITAMTVALVMVWGVASEALREIITGFLDEVRFD